MSAGGGAGANDVVELGDSHDGEAVAPTNERATPTATDHSIDNIMGRCDVKRLPSVYHHHLNRPSSMDSGDISVSTRNSGPKKAHVWMACLSRYTLLIICRSVIASQSTKPELICRW